MQDHAELHAEYEIGDTPRYRLLASDRNGFRIVRKRDGASAIFGGDDRCEQFRARFFGDEQPDEITDADHQSEAVNSVGAWAGRSKQFIYRVHSDGDVLGLDTDGCIVQWDGDAGRRYNCGETPSQFGLANLDESEIARVGVTKADWEAACAARGDNPTSPRRQHDAGHSPR